MKIKADKEGISFIKDLCNLALKAGGISNLNEVNKLLNSIEIIKENTNEDKENKKLVFKKTSQEKKKSKKVVRRRK